MIQKQKIKLGKKNIDSIQSIECKYFYADYVKVLKVER
jgi:hypothetical protein